MRAFRPLSAQRGTHKNTKSRAVSNSAQLSARVSRYRHNYKCISIPMCILIWSVVSRTIFHHRFRTLFNARKKARVGWVKGYQPPKRCCVMDLESGLVKWFWQKVIWTLLLRTLIWCSSSLMKKTILSKGWCPAKNTAACAAKPLQHSLRNSHPLDNLSDNYRFLWGWPFY